jgi:hypothetical protein
VIYTLVQTVGPLCENYFEGGNWALVRRVKQGTTWHPANDNLAGTYVFGTFPLDFSVDTFSIPFSTLANQNTQMLFRSGMPIAVAVTCAALLCCFWL